MLSDLDTWRKKIKIDKIHLPYRAIEIEKKKLNSKNFKKKDQLRIALKRIIDLVNNCDITVSVIVRDGEEYSEGQLKIEALHPSQVYIESYLSSNPNVISIVLRVIYGKFTALLLADIENQGITQLLSFLKKKSKCNDFTTNVVKIPHHGAWPSNGDELSELLTFIDAEIAVLSVGSKNKYGHVKPKLFQALIELQQNNNKRMNKFICTEVTRTCVKSASEQSQMEKSGLPQQKLCAGEITILAQTSGNWELKTETEHQKVIEDIKYAACQNRLDLSNL